MICRGGGNRNLSSGILQFFGFSLTPHEHLFLFCCNDFVSLPGTFLFEARIYNDFRRAT